MSPRLLPVVAVLLASATLQAAPELPAGCEVIRPLPQAGSSRSSVEALPPLARRRAVTVVERPIEIDVMEIYGPQLLHDAGSAENVKTVVQNAIDATNQALSDSGLANVRLRLRHVRFSQKYDTFPGPATGPEIEQDRAWYGADLLGFAVGTMPFGFGAAACRPPAYNAGCGVHWVQSINFLQYPLAYAHEVGHNLGADHDAPNAMPRDVDPHPFARAHCEPGQWRTLMSYGNPCIAPAVLRFSNPNYTFRGLPTGVVDQEDNARVIAISAPLVRDYVPSTENSTPRCEFRITFDVSDLPVAGEVRRLVAERTRGDCEPAVASLDDWVRIDVASGSTPERTEAEVTYLPNDGPLSRRGHFVVGEQPVSVTEAGAGGCLMPNGSFDHDVSGWTIRPFTERQGSVSWSTLDAAGRPDSGSAMLTVTGGQFAVQRCVAVEPSSRYVLRSSVFMPPGQSVAPTDLPAFQSVSLFDTPDCSGSDSGAGDSITYLAGRWMQVRSGVETFTNTHSAKVSLNVNVVSGPFTTYFDDVFFCRIGSASAAGVKVAPAGDAVPSGGHITRGDDPKEPAAKE